MRPITNIVPSWKVNDYNVREFSNELETTASLHITLSAFYREQYSILEIQNSFDQILYAKTLLIEVVWRWPSRGRKEVVPDVGNVLIPGGHFNNKFSESPEDVLQNSWKVWVELKFSNHPGDSELWKTSITIPWLRRSRNINMIWMDRPRGHRVASHWKSFNFPSLPPFFHFE